MRLFYAVGLPKAVRSRLAALLPGVNAIPGLRAVGAPSLHVTLRFIGDVPDGAVDRIADAGARTACPPFELALEGCGVFPSPSRPRILWVGVAGDTGALGRLAATLDERLAEAGFPGEARAFTPHVTLARPRGQAPVGSAATEAFRSIAGSFSSAHFPVKEYHLFQSRLRPSGAAYEIVRSFPLA